MPPNRPPRRPRSIDYSMLNTMERRLLQRRPLNMWSVLALRKPVMRRFLRSNGQRYKTKDRKKRLMRLIIDVIRRHDPRPASVRHVSVAPGPASTSQTGALNLQTPTPKKSKLAQGEHVRGKRCKCPVSLSELLKMPYQLPHIYIAELKKLLAAAPLKVEAVIQMYGGEPDPVGCNAKNIGIVRNLFISDLEALKKISKKEYEQLEQKTSTNLKCGICFDENQICVAEPCGHTFCTFCSESMVKNNMNRCPNCRQLIEKRHCIAHPGVQNVQQTTESI